LAATGFCIALNSEASIELFESVEKPLFWSVRILCVASVALNWSIGERRKPEVSLIGVSRWTKKEKVINANKEQAFFLDDGQVVVNLSHSGVEWVAAREGAAYRAIVSEAPDAPILVQNIVVVRDGDDLVLHYADGVSIVMADYFVVCGEGECSVMLPVKVDSEELAEVSSQDCTAIDDDRTLILAAGDPAVVMEIVQSDPALRTAVVEECIVPSSEEAGGWYWWTLAGVGAAGAAASGGGRETAIAQDPAPCRCSGFRGRLAGLVAWVTRVLTAQKL
jgi:hypothetical protein